MSGGHVNRNNENNNNVNRSDEHSSCVNCHGLR